MSEKVLFVDDEPSVLDGIRRQLRKLVELETAVGGEEGLAKLQESGPFAVVVADMRMPRMNGAEFLSKVRELSPDTMRVILSGQADLESTIAAVNSGRIYRFLTKPCPAEELWETVKAGMDQYRLINVERELLDKTLSGAVNMLTEILGITNPAAFSRASRVRRYAESMGSALGLDNNWEFKLATMLSQIGCITLPGDTLAKVYAGQALSSEETRLYDGHPDIAGRLLVSIPRLEGVAEMIKGQCQAAVTTLPDDCGQWPPQVLGAQVLRTAAEFDRLIGSGVKREDALRKLQPGTAQLIAAALAQVSITREEAQTKSVKVGQLVIGMLLDEDLVTTNGMRLMPKGQEITQSTITRLHAIAQGVGIVEPFRVTVFV